MRHTYTSNVPGKKTRNICLNTDLLPYQSVKPPMSTCLHAWAIYCHQLYASKHVISVMICEHISNGPNKESNHAQGLLVGSFHFHALLFRAIIGLVLTKNHKQQPRIDSMAIGNDFHKKRHITSGVLGCELPSYVGTELPRFWSNLHASEERMTQKMQNQHGKV